MRKDHDNVADHHYMWIGIEKEDIAWGQIRHQPATGQGHLHTDSESVLQMCLVYYLTMI